MTVSEILRADAALYEKKKADYAPGSDPWENLRFAGKFSARVCRGLPEEDPLRATMTIIGIKIARMRTVGAKGKASNEAFRDTLRDLRVYVAMAEAIMDEPPAPKEAPVAQVA